LCPPQRVFVNQHQTISFGTNSQAVDWFAKVENGRTVWRIFALASQSKYISQLSAKIVQLAKLSQQKQTYGVLLVPWMSAQLEAACLEHGIGCVDAQGNGVMRFGQIFIKITGNPAPKQDIQRQKSLFSGKATRILRLMLRNPKQTWRTQTIADATHLSLGYVHRVWVALEERGWLEKTKQGARLQHPAQLLENWKTAYTAPKPTTYYTLKHGKALQEALKDASGEHWLYASYSASEWLSPWVRQNLLYLVADQIGLGQLESVLGLKPVGSGANVIVYQDPEANLLLDRFKAQAGIWTTSPIETYLMLSGQHDRAGEAAAQLYQNVILPSWQKEQIHAV
jgi:hypothetical protein